MQIGIALSMWTDLFGAPGGLAPDNQTVLELMGAFGPTPIWAELGAILR